jgi:hypothetical protein
MDHKISQVLPLLPSMLPTPVQQLIFHMWHNVCAQWVLAELMNSSDNQIS